MKNESILITGGAGFIGSNLAEHYLERGYRVAILDDMSSGSVENIRACYNYPHFYAIRGSVTNAEVVSDAVRGANYVFHLAAQVHVEESIFDPVVSYNTNSIGTLCVLEAVRRHQPELLVYASSTEVYGTAQVSPMDELHPFNPQSPYAAGKAAADRLCSAYFHTFKTPVVILRQFNTYGPRQRFKGYSAVIPIFAHRVLQGRPPIVYGDGQQARDFHYIDDLIRAYDLIMENHSSLLGESMNFGTGKETSINELAVAIIEIGKEVLPHLRKIDLTPVHVAPRPGEVKSFAADITKARQRLGFEPAITLREGLRKYLRWFHAMHSGENA